VQIFRPELATIQKSKPTKGKERAEE
jgi:hypothetical protein